MLYLVTPCSRPENLETMSQYIPDECQWVVLHDKKTSVPKISNMISIQCPKTGFVGADARNYFIENYKLYDNDWIYSLDDDNIVHPRLMESIRNLLDQDVSLIHWGQLHRNGSIRLEPLDKIIIDTIDAACFISKWKFNKNVRYNTIEYNYDGRYAIECDKNGPRIKISDYLCYYNFLR